MLVIRSKRRRTWFQKNSSCKIGAYELLPGPNFTEEKPDSIQTFDTNWTCHSIVRSRNSKPYIESTYCTTKTDLGLSDRYQTCGTHTHCIPCRVLCSLSFLTSQCRTLFWSAVSASTGYLMSQFVHAKFWKSILDNSSHPACGATNGFGLSKTYWPDFVVLVQTCILTDIRIFS
jgi:hypothetical protein